MAKKAAAVKQWLENRKRFANLFNVKVFEGEQVIKPEDLELVEGETHLLMKTGDGTTQEIHRYRDITMRWKGEMNLMILACENQDKVHYAMPVRTMIYDGLSYVQQMKFIWDLRDKDKKVNEEEFLSKFRKEDKIFPIITLVLYLGESEWDASLDLYGMFEIEDVLRTNEYLKKYIPNYQINLIDAARLDNLEVFQEDLQMVFGLLKCRKDKKKLKEYIEQNKNFFGNIDLDTGMVISSLVNSNRIMKVVEKQKEGECIDMCKALEDWAAEERAEGKEEQMISLICKKLKKGKNITQIADEIEETENIVIELIEKYKL